MTRNIWLRRREYRQETALDGSNILLDPIGKSFQLAFKRPTDQDWKSWVIFGSYSEAVKWLRMFRSGKNEFKFKMLWHWNKANLGENYSLKDGHPIIGEDEEPPANFI